MKAASNAQQSVAELLLNALVICEILKYGLGVETFNALWSSDSSLKIIFSCSEIDSECSNMPVSYFGKIIEA